MRLDLKTKAMLFFMGAIVALSAYQHQTYKSKVLSLQEAHSKALSDFRMQSYVRIDTLVRTVVREVEMAKFENSRLGALSDSITKSIDNYETRPDISLDFNDAADIISGNDYRPSKKDD